MLNLVKLNGLNLVEERENILMAGQVNPLQETEGGVGWCLQQIFIFNSQVPARVQVVGGGEVLSEVSTNICHHQLDLGNIGEMMSG